MIITSIFPDQSFQPIEILDLKTFNPINRKVHAEGDANENKQVDVAVIEIGNVLSFKQNLSNLTNYIFNYNQFSDIAEVQNLSAVRAPVIVKSRFGYRKARMGVLRPKIYPSVPPQTLVGFRLDDISPPVQDGGDSGGAVFTEINGVQKICGMFSKGLAALVDNRHDASGAATDSVMIRETIDLFFTQDQKSNERIS